MPTGQDDRGAPSPARPARSLWGDDVVPEREELLREAERIAQAGSWAWDMRTNRVAWSDELFAILGRDPTTDEATFDNFIASIHPDDRARVYDMSARASQGEIPERAEFRVQRPDQSVRNVLGLAQVFRGPDGVPARMVGVIMDVTERKLLEQQLLQAQKMEAIGQMAGGIAHDFNNLLTVILLNTESLKRSGPRDPRLEQIHDAAASAIALTAQLLSFSRQSPRRKVELDLDVVVGSALDLVRRIIGEDVQTTFLPSSGRAPVVQADESQIHQVLLNLVVNARDAMPRGGTLTLSTEVVSVDGKPFVKLTVRDTGVGMDEATKARIFEPFFTTKAHGRGTGLGLSTVFGIVTQGGGRIEVDSALGRGSAFHLLFPLADAPATATRANDAETEQGRGEVLLVVEDDPGVRSVTCEVLRMGGYHVLAASRPSSALELWGQHRKDVALLVSDVVMPEMSGHELLEKVRADRNIPALFVTGYDPDPGERMAKATHVLAKPYTAEALLRAVRRALA